LLGLARARPNLREIVERKKFMPGTRPGMMQRLWQ
jgi:hypothetical protein